MFTGIIQQKGKIERLQEVGDAKTFFVDAGEISSQLSRGDSLAVNGTCLTVEELNNNLVQLTAIAETLEKTNLGLLKAGDSINLEPAATMGTFMGGHMVSGHVDGVVELLEIIDRETGQEVVLSITDEFSRYIIHKGSVALDGVSLTVAEKTEQSIRIALIPETLERTNIGEWTIGQKVNLEVDPIGKYVENFLRGTQYLPEDK